jgi:hypothetical protein
LRLTSLLRNLPHSGLNGLEGLVAHVAAELLGAEARLEASGPQGGRDIGLFDLATGQSIGVDIESKRYDAKTRPRRRELLGEIAETREDRPDTHLWILVSTTALPAKLAAELVRVGLKSDLDVLVLDTPVSGLSRLAAMIALGRLSAERWFQTYHAGKLADAIVALDQAVANPLFPVLAGEIPLLLHGRYATSAAIQRARAWLQDRVGTTTSADPGLRRRLGRQHRAPAVRRPRIDEMIQLWTKELKGRRLMALLGSEGDGKTWAAIDLLLSVEKTAPLLLTADMIDDGGAEGLLAKALARQCGGDEDVWRARLIDRWPEDFHILVLIDGPNEAPHKRFDHVIADLLDAPFANQVDIVVTCRTPFWETRVQPYVQGVSRFYHFYEVGGFDDEEWPQVLAHLGPKARDLPDSVTEALRNPINCATGWAALGN